MIIFGTRVRYKVIGEGQFFCPRCQTRRAYQHKRASRYFALYFVPLIPMGQLGEFVECQTCHAIFEPGVLQIKAPAQPRPAQGSLAQMLNTLQVRLDGGTPVEFLLRDLTAAGLDRDVALGMIDRYLAGERKTCKACGLTYAKSASTCAECHQPLE